MDFFHEAKRVVTGVLTTPPASPLLGHTGDALMHAFSSDVESNPLAARRSDQARIDEQNLEQDLATSDTVYVNVPGAPFSAARQAYVKARWLRYIGDHVWLVTMAGRQAVLAQGCSPLVGYVRAMYHAISADEMSQQIVSDAERVHRDIPSFIVDVISSTFERTMVDFVNPAYRAERDRLVRATNVSPDANTPPDNDGVTTRFGRDARVVEMVDLGAGEDPPPAAGGVGDDDVLLLPVQFYYMFRTANATGMTAHVVDNMGMPRLRQALLEDRRRAGSGPSGGEAAVDALLSTVADMDAVRQRIVDECGALVETFHADRDDRQQHMCEHGALLNDFVQRIGIYLEQQRHYTALLCDAGYTMPGHGAQSQAATAEDGRSMTPAQLAASPPEHLRRTNV